MNESAIMRHGHLLSLLHRLVHLVSTSVGSDVPRWAIQPMKYEIGKYLKDSVDILVVGGEEGGNFAYDYSLDGLYRLLATALGDEIARDVMEELPEHMAVFHFPFGERDNVLAHGAFFHEVAHQIDIGIRGISERVVTQFLADYDAELRQRVRSASEILLQQIFGDDKKGEQKSFEEEQAELLLEDFVKAVQGILWNWAREFCADLLATRILGPAYAVVVVISPALLHNLNYHSPSHPSTMLRLKVVLDLLSHPEAGDFFQICGTALERAGIRRLLEDWRARSSGANYGAMKWISPAHPANPTLHGAVIPLAQKLALDILTSVVEETKEQEYYSPGQYNEDIETVLPILEQWITINERINTSTREHNPNGISTIYNVGVARFLQEESLEKRRRLSRLLKKSIELSYIQQALQT